MKIGLYLKNLDEEYQISVYKGIRAEAEKLGIELICIQGGVFNETTRSQQKQFPLRQYLSVDGILLLSSVISSIIRSPAINTLFNSVPCISIGTRLFDFPSIIIRNRTSMERLMDHLINFHGYRKFLFIGGTIDHRDNIVREHIFRRVLNTYRRYFPELEGTVINGRFNESTGMQITQNYIAEHADNPLDAIVTANDNMAIGALKVLHTISDPRWQKCAVTGFDDIPQAELEVPSLTTVHQPLDTMGTLAVRTLYDLICGHKVQNVLHIDSYLCIRASCGCTETITKQNDINETKERDSISGSSSGNPLLILKQQLTRIQYQSIKSEQHLRNISTLGQQLTTVESMGELVCHLRSFLDSIGNHFFFLLLYPQPYQEGSDNIQLVYERIHIQDVSYTDENRIISLHYFFGEGYPHDSEGPSARCIYNLTSGNEYLGMIVYEAEDYAHPYMCSCGIFIANTVKRLKIMADEKIRSRQLEKQVILRTKDLTETNKKLKKEAKRRIAVEAEVLRISEMERQRFSQDLHDDICQRLAGISMFCKSLSGQKTEESNIRELADMLDETLTRTRQYAHDSFPVELNTLGLKEALGSLCHTIEKQTGLTCIYSWTVTGKTALNRSGEINLYRIVQEALQNVIKHAKATRIEVRVYHEKKQLIASVKDNGIGNSRITINTVFSAKGGKRQSGLGLRSMQYRAHQIGAKYIFSSSEKNGTLVEIRIPDECRPGTSPLDQDF